MALERTAKTEFVYCHSVLFMYLWQEFEQYSYVFVAGLFDHVPRILLICVHGKGLDVERHTTHIKTVRSSRHRNATTLAFSLIVVVTETTKIEDSS